jgi:putative hydrolase of the HAD superfamily
VRVVGLDGDDTLWSSESKFALTNRRFTEMVRGYTAAPDLERRLLDVVRANLRLFGYGVKSYVLCLIETAIQVTDGRISTAEIHELIAIGKAMLDSPVELLDGAREAVEHIGAAGYRLLLVTKGDLLDQEGKIARSGLADMFSAVEIVTEKDERTYGRMLRRHSVAPEEFLMVGNSPRSDVLPVLSLGGSAIHVPHPVTWALEAVDRLPGGDGRLFRIESLRELPGLLTGPPAPPL